MDDPNITMEEYIRLEEEKAQKRGKVFNRETAKYAIVFNDNLTSNETLFCEPTVSSLNDNEIDFRISFDKSDDEDYMVVFDKNSFSYKIISTNDLKTDSENDNEKVNMPLFSSPKPTVSCIDDLDFFKDFENEFPAIVYNDALMSKSDFSTEPTLCPQHINEFDLKDETSFSKYVEKEQNVLYFNNLFPFNISYPDLKLDKDNDDNKIDMIQSSGGNENTKGSNNQLEGSHDKISKVFIMKSFVMKLNVNIEAWNYLVNGMLFNLIKNLYVPFGIPFDPKRYYKDGDCTRMLRRPRYKGAGSVDIALPPRDQRNQYLSLEALFDIRGPLVHELILEFFSTFRFGEAMLDLDTPGALQFQLGGVRRRMSWREFILALGLHSAEEIIAGRSQAPEKVTVTNSFYLRGMDVGSVNVPYLLARYLRLFAFGRKQGEMIYEGPARQEGNAGGVAEEAPVVPGGGNEDEEMPQAVPPLPRTQGERIAQLKEELMDRAGVPYTRYSESPVEYQRRTRQRTDSASTSTASQQPDP
ncbi:hypothetical protein Tco_1096784 [Tanacetum coccineum]